MPKQQATTINIFVDYTPDDESIASEVLKHLSFLNFQYKIEIWHHGMIRAGQRRDVLQAAALGKADIVLLIVSSDYLSSKSYQQYEKEFVRMCESRAATFIPILAKTSMWDFSPLGRFGIRSLPTEDKTIFHSRNKAQTYTEIVQDLIPVIEMKLEEKPKEKAKFEEELEKKVEQTTIAEKGNENVQNEDKDLKTTNFKAYIRHLVEKNEVADAFKEIDKVLKYSNDTKLKGSFSLFKSRYNRAENDMMRGRITSENMYVEQTRVLEGLMVFLDKIPEGIVQQVAEGSAVYLDSIIKVSEDKPKDSITNNGEGNANIQGTTVNGDINIDMSSNKKNDKKEKSKKEDGKKVLMYVSSCPDDDDRYPNLRFDKEEQKMRDILKASPKRDYITFPPSEKNVQITTLGKVFPKDTSYMHIATHGEPNQLIFINNKEEVAPVYPQRISNYLKRNNRKEIKLEFVFFTACHSTIHAQSAAQHIYYSIGMNTSVPDDAIILFVETFYELFFNDFSIEDAFDDACSMLKFQEAETYKIPQLYVNTELIAEKKGSYEKHHEHNSQIIYIEQKK